MKTATCILHLQELSTKKCIFFYHFQEFYLHWMCSSWIAVVIQARGKFRNIAIILNVTFMFENVVKNCNCNFANCNFRYICRWKSYAIYFFYHSNHNYTTNRMNLTWWITLSIFAYLNPFTQSAHCFYVKNWNKIEKKIFHFLFWYVSSIY